MMPHDEWSEYIKERLTEQKEELLKMRVAIHELRNTVHGRIGPLELLIERHNTALEKQNTFFVTQMSETKEEVAKLKVKTVFFGAAAGFVITMLKEVFLRTTGK